MFTADPAAVDEFVRRRRRLSDGGGLGAVVATVVAEHHPTPMRILGAPDVFAPTGSVACLLEHFGVTAGGSADAARSLLRQ
jgi:transketolase